MLNSFAWGHLNKPVTAREGSERFQTKAAMRIPRQQSLEGNRVYGANYDFGILNTV